MRFVDRVRGDIGPTVSGLSPHVPRRGAGSQQSDAPGSHAARGRPVSTTTRSECPHAEHLAHCDSEPGHVRIGPNRSPGEQIPGYVSAHATAGGHTVPRPTNVVTDVRLGFPYADPVFR